MLYASVVVGGANGYTCINLLDTLGVNLTSKAADAARLGDTWAYSKGTLMGMSYSGSGSFDYYADTTGQKYVVDQAINGTETWFKHRYGSGTDWIKSQVEVTGVTIKTTTAGMVDFSFTADSTGTISEGSDEIV
jgi:hypothetical protein